MGRVKCTASPLPASKNTSSPKLYWAHQRGLDSEQYVLNYYHQKGYQILAQRLKTPFAEVDLLFRSPEGHILMVEVKTANLQTYQVHRISWKQKARLIRALQFLAARFEALVEVHWAFVTKDGAVTIIEDISG